MHLVNQANQSNRLQSSKVCSCIVGKEKIVMQM